MVQFEAKCRFKLYVMFREPSLKVHTSLEHALTYK